MTDKIEIAFSLAELEKEVKKSAPTAEPLHVAIGGDKKITFGDPSAIGIFTLLDLQDGDGDVLGMLRGILSEEDYDALRAVNPSAKVLGALMERVTAHYAPQVGAPKSGD